MLFAPRKTLLEFYEQIYRPRKLVGKDKGRATSQQYHIVIRQFGRFLHREPLLSDLNDQAVCAFLTWFGEEQNGNSTLRSPATVKKARSHLRALWQYAAMKRFVQEFPDLPQINQPIDVPKAYLLEEIGRLIRSAREQPGHISEIPAWLYWPALFQFLYWTGLRPGIPFALFRQDIDLASSFLVVPARIQKHKQGQAFHLHQEVVEALRAIWLPERELLFPWPYHRVTKYGKNHLRAICARAGIPYGRWALQRIRRSTASYTEAAGGDSTKLLGHSSRRITERHYHDPRICGGPQAAEILPRPPIPDSL